MARVPAARLDPAALPDVAAAVAPDDARVDIDDLPRYSRALRRELRPYWLRVRTSTDVRRARRLLAAAGGKGHMEWWVLLVNRPVETWLSYHVTEWRVTPNQITFASNVAAVAAAVAFATGRLWLGLAAALANSILDGLDGRQARVQLKTSKVGELEHVFDALSEIAWVGALAWHLSGGLADAAIGWGALLWLAAYAADNAAYTFFRVRRGMMIDEASRIDAAVRFVGARRNTNFAYFAAALALGAPRVGFWIIAVGTAVTAAVHWLRVAVLLARPARAAAAVVDR
ncbi:MAG: hypothetical protein D6689_20810 [Deltaproteobacteria bacterium]|nr:MAG: hypothetical protein D6689_20810 [Deltaproteobacteria bacterium]